GNDLKGKKLGKGLVQRKDGRYMARFTSKTGARVTEYFHTEREARAWYQDAVYNDKHNSIIPPFDMIASDIVNYNAALPSFNDMTVDEWFEFWMKIHVRLKEM
ncbi:MAG: hypothetical protein K6G19_11750, partial [Lachnospiraceae bacterium]|nr:hypothetical protein [Lachnospiraceae bacterium]